MGVPPTILWGRQRRTYTVGGLTEHDPEWLQYDYALLAMLEEWEAGLCPGCNEPRESHVGKTASDYAAAYITCPAAEAMEAEQVRQAKRDGIKDAKPDPSRARRWVAMTVAAMREWAASETNKTKT